MDNGVISYAFSESNKTTVVFVPGYSGGLEAPVIQALVEHFSTKTTNVFGIPMSYENDTPDLYNTSQERLITCLQEIKAQTPETEIILMAKSLGGSLALFNSDKLPVQKIVVLGCSVVLGWPQRISLLKASELALPDYKTQWGSMLASLSIPTLIISGEKDDLTDNAFLAEETSSNSNIHLLQLENTNHSLEDVESGTVPAQLILTELENFLK